MALPAPNLDDRRFQNLVDDAKRLVQRRCPEWTDHNVSDPGVTLIETFAYMTDQLLYRLNRVPDRNYIKFLELIGVRLFPPTAAATTKVTFWLSAPQEIPIVVPLGVEVATPRTEAVGSAIAFTTTGTLDIVPCEMSLRRIDPGRRDLAQPHRHHQAGAVFLLLTAAGPGRGAAHRPVGGRAALRRQPALRLHHRGHRRGPRMAAPGLGGLRRRVLGRVRGGHGHAPAGSTAPARSILHVPPTHVMSLEHQLRAGWLRARVTTPEEDQPFYSNSPLIHGLDARTIGGTIEAVQAEVIEEEVIGLSEGVPGQRFAVARTPVVPSGEPVVLEVSDEEEGWQDWVEVSNFAQSQPDDRHFVLDAVGRRGAARAGRAHARRAACWATAPCPPKGAVLRLRRYHTGGGRQGNVAQTAIRVSPDDDPVRGARREPLPGDRRGRRRGHRRGQDPRADRDAHPGPSGDRGGLRAAGQGGRPRSGPDQGRSGRHRRGRRRGPGPGRAGGRRRRGRPAVVRAARAPAGDAHQRRQPSWTPAGPSAPG